MFLGRYCTKASTFYTAIVTLVSMTACKVPDQRILDEFKKADSSLQATDANVLPGDSMQMLHLQVLARQQANPTLAVTADSVFVITSCAVGYIDSLKQVLLKLDSTSETSVATNKVSGNGTAGKQLYSYLIQVHVYAAKAIITKSKLARLDNFFAFETDMPDDKIFVRKFFNNTPDIATLTMLSKFQNDCRAAAILALDDIKEAMAKSQ